MINLNEILKGIEKEGIVEKTTKELKEAGLNDYYIKKAVRSGALEQVSRGKYKIVALEKAREQRHSFYEFSKAVLKNDYENAYTWLVRNLENQVNHDYDYNLRLYFLLLKEILKDKKDFSFLDDILIFTDNPRNNTYYDHFIDFKEAILSNQFEEAYQAITLFKSIEKSRKAKNYISTDLFYCLTEHIHVNKKREESAIKIQKDTQKSGKEEYEQKTNYKKYYSKMAKDIENNNYEEALDNLKKASTYALPKAQSRIRKMINMIEKYLEIKSSGETLPEVTIDYSMIKEDDYNTLLNVALEQKDYKTAYKNIGKTIYFIPESRTLQLYQKLLYTLIDQNKANKKRAQQQIPKKIIPVETHKIDIELFTQLIYDRNYQQAEKLLENANDERLCRCTKQLLKEIELLENKTYKKAKPHIYKNEEHRKTKKFYEALNCRDYQEAYNLLKECLEVSKSYNKDISELIIYSYLLEDILELEIGLQEERKQEEELKALRTQQKNLLFKRKMSKEDIERLESITNSLILLSPQEEIYDLRILEMLETLQSIDEFNLDINSFATFEYSENSILEKFLKAINLGDYQSAYQMTTEEKWYQENKKSPNKTVNLMYRKLLYLMNTKLEQDNKNSYQETIDDMIDIPVIDHLKTLKTLIKNRDFITAQKYYQESNFAALSENLDLELQVFLQFLSQPVKNEEKELKQECKNFTWQGDCEQAKKSLAAYREFIEQNHLDRNIDYYELRLSSMEQEKNTPDFQKKERLYNRAKKQLNKGNYSSAFNIINNYIERDNDLSAKGYLLRGRCLEYMNNYEGAKKDYKKAISIIPEPNAYHCLGRVNNYQNNYQDAVECFLEYEERRPGHHQHNLEALSYSYQKLGNEELSAKYKTLAKKAK